MLRYVVAALCVAFVAAQTPARPVIKTEFMAEFEFRDVSHNHTEEGRGHWAHDSLGKRAVEHMMENERPGEMPHFETMLWRFDEHVEYFVTGPRNHSECTKHALNGSIPSPFAWLATATYQGKHTIPPHAELDIWGAKIGDSQFELGVVSTAPNTPVVFLTRSTGRERAVHFESFTQTTPPAELFEVPPSCQHPPPQHAQRRH